MNESSLDPDFRDMLSAFLNAKVEFLLVGGYAMSAHGINRYTRDIDLFVRASVENSRRIWLALAVFGAPKLENTPEDFAKPNMVMQFGVPPKRIDILTSIAGVDFDEAWAGRMHLPMDGLSIPVIGRKELIQNKRAAGREQDVLDVKNLEKIKARKKTKE